MEPAELTQESFTSQFRTMPQPPPAPPHSPPEGNTTTRPRQSAHSTAIAADFDAETIRAMRGRQDAIAAERSIDEIAAQARAINSAARAIIVSTEDGTVASRHSGAITTTPNDLWQNGISQRDSFNFRHIESKVLKLEEKLVGAKTAIEMLIEEYGKLSKKLDEREEEHSMLISELYKLKTAGEK